MKSSFALLLAFLACLATAGPAAAEKDRAPAPTITDEMVAAGLLAAHPDLRWRGEGRLSYDAGRYDVAMAEFKRAARYADKPSAAMVGEMYWAGQGVPVDRALAYAWMDLAAERLWQPFLARREAFWSALSEDERTRALDVGRAVYAEFGDAVAKKRKESVLSRERRRITGSRVGFVGALTIEIPSIGGNIRIRGDEFYDPVLWNPDLYWRWQDDLWRDARPASIEVGPLETVRLHPTSPEPRQR